MSLRAIDVRILGALLEKAFTTPDAYPLSTNALLIACNQKTNRDPVTDFHLRDVEDALQVLRDRGLVRSRRGDGERVVKHEHRLEEAFELGRRELALLAVLMLRGRQTPGELRNRTERYLTFPDLAAVETSLARLTAHQPPLAENHGRGPGQSQDRWGHTLGPDPDRLRPRVRPTPQPAGPSALETAEDDPGSAFAELQREVRSIRRDLERVLDALGLEGSDGAHG